jgi:uncharacterized protein (TIGR03790 family)
VVFIRIGLNVSRERNSAWGWLALIILGAAFSRALAVAPEEVVVVYNSQGLGYDAAILAAYQNAHPGVPGIDAPYYLDINDGTLPAADIDYPSFVAKIRNPIRAAIDGWVGNRGEIKALQLLRGLPHRIRDPFPTGANTPNLGDSGSATQNELLANNVQAASVDAELVLLWQDLEIGQSASPMSSPSDQFIGNPFFESASAFDSFNRNNISVAKNWVSVSAGSFNYWTTSAFPPSQQLRPGDLVLVARLDGNSVQDVVKMIGRSQNLEIHPGFAGIILDKDTRNPPFDGTNYQDASTYLTTVSENAWNVTLETTNNFVAASEYTGPCLIYYASYGANHAPDGGQNTSVYMDGFRYRLLAGASFNTYESWNGRKLNGLGDQGQEQGADFISAGGTFALGHVWEPFTFAVANDKAYLEGFLDQGRTFFEAAYRSLPVLSWMNVAIGDGLGKIEPLAPTAYAAWRLAKFGNGTSPEGEPAADPENDGRVNFLEYALGGDPLLSDPAVDPVLRLDPPADGITPVVLEYPKAATGLGYSVLRSPDLGPSSWVPVNSVEKCDPDKRLFFKTYDSPSSDLMNFLRLEVAE